MSESVVSYNATLGRLAGAYLAMWTALQSFDPETDRWAEPTDFGTREERVRQAREAVKLGRPGAVEATVPSPSVVNTLGEELDRDERQFEEILKSLETGESFNSTMRKFTDHLGAEGSRLSDESVALASVAQT